ncbi:DUF4817 domain-containing protein [Trichonephila clavipes]|nr:DUF4817 domain-containing protein [Trichonephila clavipes]
MVQALKPTDKRLRKNFCVKFQKRFDVDGFENTLVFTDEATFLLCGKVNRHNLRFGGPENVHGTLEHQRDSPKLEEAVPDFILQQDGASPHWNKNVREFLNKRLPHRWIGRTGSQDLTYLHWPPRSPDLAPCDFFLWGFVKDKVFMRPLPQDLEELNSIARNMLSRVWQELDYRVDICCVTGGAHIKHL